MSKKSILIRIAESRVPFAGSILLIALGIMGGLGVFGQFNNRTPITQQFQTQKVEMCVDTGLAPCEAPVEEPRSVKRLKVWFADLDKEAVRLTAENKSGEADVVRRELAKYKAMFDGTIPFKKTSESEVHAVGVYEGDGCIHGPGSDKRVPGYVSVDVKYTDRPVTLVLVSYEPVIWQVNVADGAKLTKVYADGFYEQTVNGIDKSVPVIKLKSEESGTFGYAYDWDSKEYKELCTSVKQVINKDVATFLGKYNTRDPIVIGPASADWRAQMTLGAMNDFHTACTAHERLNRDKALSAINFEGIWITGSRFEMQREPLIQFGKLNFFGPEKATLKDVEAPAFAGVRGKNGNILYLASDHGIAKFDTTTKQVSSLVVPKPLPELSWISGIAHDTKRGRILVSAHQNSFYSYDEDKSKWSMMDNDQSALCMLGGLTYYEPEDCLYAISTDSSSYRQTLHKFDPEGKIISSVEVSDVLYPFELASGHLQLNVSGDYIIGLSRSDIGMSDTLRSFAIDRTTGRVLSSKLMSASGKQPS